MNDFTKEDLERILAALTDWCSPASDLKPYVDIRIKIQSMIENYCNHEFEIEYTPHNLCKKCKARK